MTTWLFRALLIASVVFSLFGTSLDFMVPELLPEQLRVAQASAELATYQHWPDYSVALAIGVLVLFLVSLYGLYMFRPWAPSFSLVTSALVLVAVSLGAPLAQSGVALAFNAIGNALWGAVLVLAYASPTRELFSTRDS